MKLKRTIALILCVFMIAVCVPFYASANENNPTITVSSATNFAGATVDIAISVANNPGILGATLKITFGSLTLVGASNGDAFDALTMTKPGAFASPCNFVWDGQELEAEDIKDGAILNLQFKIPDDAKEGDEYPISVSYTSGDIIDGNLVPVSVNIANGKVSVISFIPGDLNNDGFINTTDVILLRRHIAGGYNQTIIEAAADVNNDGIINTTDVILIRRYIAGGYGVELMPAAHYTDVHRIVKLVDVVPTDDDEYMAKYQVYNPYTGAVETLYGSTTAAKAANVKVKAYGDMVTVTSTGKVDENAKSQQFKDMQKYWILSYDADDDTLEICPYGDLTSVYYVNADKASIVRLGSDTKWIEDVITWGKMSVLDKAGLASGGDEIKCYNKAYTEDDGQTYSTKYAKYVKATILIDWEDETDFTVKDENGFNGDAVFAVVWVMDGEEKELDV
jgi:hypothetical protein